MQINWKVTNTIERVGKLSNVFCCQFPNFYMKPFSVYSSLSCLIALGYFPSTCSQAVVTSLDNCVSEYCFQANKRLKSFIHSSSITSLVPDQSTIKQKQLSLVVFFSAVVPVSQTIWFCFIHQLCIVTFMFLPLNI